MKNPDPRTDDDILKHSSALAVRTPTTIVALLGVFFLSGWFGYRAYLESPEVLSADLGASRHAATPRCATAR